MCLDIVSYIPLPSFVSAPILHPKPTAVESSSRPRLMLFPRTSHVTFIHNAASVTTKTSAVTLLSSFRPSTQPLPLLSATFRNILILRLLTSMVVPSMTSQPPTSPRALKSSSSGNAERPRLVHRSSTVEVPSLREVSRDENARPSCPVAATLGMSDCQLLRPCRLLWR